MITKLRIHQSKVVEPGVLNHARASFAVDWRTERDAFQFK